mmetsp:Transcript_141751/g.369548  ORF Transcript_141751/g.369548 Transcript_141751/m.369548 type:complete len:205 (-) Transcript_141751:100-714(-)
MTALLPGLHISSLYRTNSSRGFMNCRVSGPFVLWSGNRLAASEMSGRSSYSGLMEAHIDDESLRKQFGAIGAFNTSTVKGSISCTKRPPVLRRFISFRVVIEAGGFKSTMSCGANVAEEGLWREGSAGTERECDPLVNGGCLVAAAALLGGKCMSLARSPSSSSTMRRCTLRRSPWAAGRCCDRWPSFSGGPAVKAVNSSRMRA